MKYLIIILLFGSCAGKPIDYKKEQGFSIAAMEMQSEIEDLHKMIIFQCWRQNVLEGVIMSPTKTHDLDTSGYYWEHAYYDSLGTYEQKFYERLADINRMLKYKQ